MAAKHTPGPWIWTFDSNDFASLVHPHRGHLLVMAQPRFAFWPNMDGGLERGRMGGVMRKLDALNAEDHPDARLIAAAPELLAALKQIVGDWNTVSPDAPVPDEINVDDHWAAARAAIAKAEGGVP